MRKFMLAGAFALTMPTVGAAAPLCVAGDLAGYVVMVGGCEIGGATFSAFSAAPSLFGGDEIAAGAITVTPVATPTGPRLDFGLSASVGTGDPILGVLIGYAVTGLSFTGAELSMAGSAATEDGAVTVVEDLCLEDSFLAPAVCLAASDTLIVAQDSIGLTSPDSGVFAASFFDVFVDITIDPGLFGTASLNGTVTTRFDAAAPVLPEPSALVLMGAGLAGMYAKRRRRHVN